MDYSSLAWLAILVVFIVAEASTVTVVSIWFAAGSLAALVASMLHAKGWLQVLVFLVVSTACLILLRPVVRKFFTPRLHKTNTDALLGAQGVVTEDIDNVRACGAVKLGAMTWTARSSTGEPIKADTLVTVERIEGVKVFVKVKE